jgi:hypothetical protein
MLPFDETGNFVGVMSIANAPALKTFGSAAGDRPVHKASEHTAAIAISQCEIPPASIAVCRFSMRVLLRSVTEDCEAGRLAPFRY